MRYIENVVTLQLDVAKCVACGMCAIVCPHAVFEVDKQATIRDRDACMECGACARNCPTQAITVAAGVGCASGIIAGMLRGTDACCDEKCCCR